jgi:predicted dehydrogenase
MDRGARNLNGGLSDTVRIGVLGCGQWGPNHIRNFLSLQHAGARMVTAADPSIERRRYVESMYPTIAVVADSEEVIADPDIDAIVIATPARTHFHLARRALEAGKHVLVEKPFATSFAEARELARIASTNNRVLMAGHTFQYASAVSYIRDMVSSGELGDLTYIRSLRLNLDQFRTNINVLWDLAPHDLSILLYVLERFPKTVQATARARVNHSILDVANITLDFGDQLAAHIIVSSHDPQKVRKMTFVGDRKMLVYDSMSPSEKIQVLKKGIELPLGYDPTENVAYFHRQGDILIPTIREAEPLHAECEHFIECCQLGKIPRSGAASGAAVTAIIEAAQQSIRSDGKLVPLDMFDHAAPFEDWLDRTLTVLPGASDTVSGARAANRSTANDAPGEHGSGPRQRYNAMVVDPDESRRLFATDALIAFEPGFDVVTVPDLDEASEWIESFIPDLLVMSENIEQSAAEKLINSVSELSKGRHCRVLSIRRAGNGEATTVSSHHTAVSEDAGLSEWLAAVQHMFAHGELTDQRAKSN